MRAPRPLEGGDPEKPVYFQRVLNTSKPSIDSPSVDDDGPTYPRHFPLLQLPVELQLEVIDRIYDISNASGDTAERALLLNLRLYVFQLWTRLLRLMVLRPINLTQDLQVPCFVMLLARFQSDGPYPCA